MWSNRFDRTLDDVFAIQDEISLAIVNELRLTLGRGQRRYQTNLAAYDLYLRGRALVARRGTESAEQAARLFEQVIAIDREFAPAHAGLADAYATMSWAIDAPETALAGMRPAAVKALQMDPELAEAHTAMGITYAREFNWENATSSFERAIALNPNLSEIRTSYSFSTLVPQGQAAKALDILAAAMEMDPLSLAVKREVGIAQFVGGRYEEAIVNLRQVVAADPDFTYAANLLARALTFAGRPEEAIALWESRPQPSDWERWLMPAYVKLGRRADVDRAPQSAPERPSISAGLELRRAWRQGAHVRGTLARRCRCPAANRRRPRVPGDGAAPRRPETRSAPKAIQPSLTGQTNAERVTRSHLPGDVQAESGNTRRDDGQWPQEGRARRPDRVLFRIDVQAVEDIDERRDAAAFHPHRFFDPEVHQRDVVQAPCADGLHEQCHRAIAKFSGSPSSACARTVDPIDDAIPA